MMSIYNLNALSIEQRKAKKLLLVFLSELRFDTKRTGNKSFRERTLAKLFKSPVIRAGSLKTSKSKGSSRIFLSSNPKERIDRQN